MMAVAVCLVLAAPAAAEWGLSGFAVTTSESAPQAGSHPDFTTALHFESPVSPIYGIPMPEEQFSTVVTHLPAGLIGDAGRFPTCSRERFEFAAQNGGCPSNTRVGEALVAQMLFGYGPPDGIFNITPAPGEAAKLGILYSGQIPIYIDIAVRDDSDYGLVATASNIQTFLPITDMELTLWGVPSRRNGSGAPEQPFMTYPTDCTDALNVGLEARSYQQPDRWISASGALPTPNGCAGLDFMPTADVTPDTVRPDTPTGLSVDLSFPQNDDVDGQATPALRKAVVDLPPGLTLNPGAADGLAACTDAQSAIGTRAAASCPAAAKIGTATIDVPALRRPLSGALYLGTQESNDPVSGKMFRMFLVADGQGVHLKLEGAVRADAGSGRLQATFANNPQVPASEIALHFTGGPRAVLATPATCGPKTTTTQLDSWGGQSVTRRSTFQVPCDHALGGFAPSLAAGVVDPIAGASSPFVLRFGRSDGQQELGAVNGSLPPGLLGVLASVPLCSAAQGAAGTCPAASRVGKVQVAAGSGNHPLWLPAAGRPENAVYLTEPYRKGDVAGMSVVVPAVAGPFDLGTVVTKVYLRLRDEDQGIDFQSDRLPRVVGGVPVRIRELVMTIDRKGFMVNPTNCTALATYANVFSQAWTKASVTSRFQVANCAVLPMSPVIAARAGGQGNVQRYTHPSLRVTVRQPAGQAHLDKAYVVLPKALNIDLKAPALKAACPRDLYAKDQCSPVATVGTARAVTPLLRQPLTGPAFLIQKKGQLPDLVMRLRNNRMSLDLIGVLDFLKDGRLITRVKGIPDAALSSFALSITGGKNGSLLNRSSLCARHRLVKATFQGQNGKLAYKTPLLHVAGCAKAVAKQRVGAKRQAKRASGHATRAASARASAVRGAHAGPIHERAAGGRS